MRKSDNTIATHAMMAGNLRSKVVTQGVQRSPNRAMLRAVGFTDADFTKTIKPLAKTLV
jgi:dihydroxy-acid dehydratase